MLYTKVDALRKLSNQQVIIEQEGAVLRVFPGESKNKITSVGTHVFEVTDSEGAKTYFSIDHIIEIRVRTMEELRGQNN